MAMNLSEFCTCMTNDNVSNCPWSLQKVITTSISEDTDKEEECQDSKVTEDRTTRTYTMAVVSQHCDVTSCWIVLWDKVYDITKFLSQVNHRNMHYMTGIIKSMYLFKISLSRLSCFTLGPLLKRSKYYKLKSKSL